jgi:transmembrane serine protease 9
MRHDSTLPWRRGGAVFAGLLVVTALAGAAFAGDVTAPQIVGGSKALPGEFPWQVALLDARVSNTFDAQYCGGALVAPTWVMTAAHCVYDRGVQPPGSVDVLVGTTSLTSGGKRVDVDRIVVHARYNERTSENDIALLHLAAAVADPSVPLLSRARETELASAGTLATATGWGDTLVRGNRYPTDLMKVQLPIVTNRTCNDPRSYDGDVAAKMLCAGYAAGGRDTCQGDSGGPLVVPDGEGGFALAGVTSWGARCAAPRKYGVYTRVARFAAWAEKVMASRHRGSAARVSGTRVSVAAHAAPP